MEFKGIITNAIRTFEDDFILEITTKANNLSIDELNKLKMAKNGLKIEIKQWREQRSLNANAYAWVLMEQIAKETNQTKVDVYRDFIKRVGVFEILPIRDIAVKTFMQRWESKGIGWVCEILGDSKIPNYTNIIAYYGTSTYNTEEMARLIDDIVESAKELGIETMTPNEIAEMKSLWSEYEK